MENEALQSSTPEKPAAYSNSSSKVRVIARVRPFLPREVSSKNGNTVSCVSVLDKGCEAQTEVTVHIKDMETSRNECFQLDSFFGQEDNNVSHIFYKEVKTLITGIFHGCNATVFAYGATGSGKTYTMQGSDENPGLMTLAMSKILSMCQSTNSTAKISYYEVYLERCYDLLEPTPKEFSILDDKAGQIHLRGLSRVPINSMSEFYEVLSCGTQRRKIAHTGLNDVSSRSHGVLVISVSSPSSDGSETVFRGKLNLIDLAGNEDNRRSCNEGIRIQESSKINQSLFALSNVIHALNKNLPRVPYRETKLTRILQDSLGGTCRALMVACLNPGEYQESVRTVALASRSRHVVNVVPSTQKLETPNEKVDMEGKLLAWRQSKGKTKSIQRMGGFGTPFSAKTASSVKKASNFQNSVKTKTNQSAARKSLSPITANDNQKCPEQFSSSGEFCKNLFEAKTPKTPFPLNSAVVKLENLGTPLDKFTLKSSNLKSCLIQDYIEFLNTADREELLELKGIGVKIADYIVELREASPLKSLNDLEKIGLSFKQIQNLFSRAARGIFERPEEDGIDSCADATSCLSI